MPNPGTTRPAIERVRPKLVRDEETGCLIFTGALYSNGYGHTTEVVDGVTRSLLVHRVVYEAEVGPIPDGFTVDHVYERGCRSKACAEPRHLEAVPHGANVSRARRLNQSKCAKGLHPWVESNLIYMHGRPTCRACNEAWRAARGGR